MQWPLEFQRISGLYHRGCNYRVYNGGGYYAQVGPYLIMTHDKNAEINVSNSTGTAIYIVKSGGYYVFGPDYEPWHRQTMRTHRYCEDDLTLRCYLMDELGEGEDRHDGDGQTSGDVGVVSLFVPFPRGLQPEVDSACEPADGQ